MKKTQKIKNHKQLSNPESRLLEHPTLKKCSYTYS